MLDVPTLEAKRLAYQEALTLIKELLAGKGIHYNAAKPPYFFTTADPALQGQATRTVNWNYNATYKGAHLMGAAVNLGCSTPTPPGSTTPATEGSCSTTPSTTWTTGY